MRAVWCEDAVSVEGRWHQVTKAGINPRPTSGEIPIWMGGSHERVIDRVGRLGDGWFPLRIDTDQVISGIARIRAAAIEAGRDPDAIGTQGSITAGGDTADQVEAAKQLEQAGATHAALFTSGAGFSTPQQHIDAITSFAEQYAAGS